MRGPLAPRGVPVAQSRSQRFDDLVLEAVDRLERRHPQALAEIEFAVEEVPDPRAGGPAGAVPLGSAQGGRQGGGPGRVVLYRRPIEMRTRNREDLADLVEMVLADQIAELLGVAPEELDP